MFVDAVVVAVGVVVGSLGVLSFYARDSSPSGILPMGEAFMLRPHTVNVLIRGHAKRTSYSLRISFVNCSWAT